MFLTRDLRESRQLTLVEFSPEAKNWDAEWRLGSSVASKATLTAEQRAWLDSRLSSLTLPPDEPDRSDSTNRWYRITLRPTSGRGVEARWEAGRSPPWESLIDRILDRARWWEEGPGGGDSPLRLAAERQKKERAEAAAKQAADRESAKARLEPAKEEMRRRAIAAGLATPGDVDGVLARMDASRFKQLKGDLPVSRVDFK